MTPEEGKITLHYNYLLTGEPATASPRHQKLSASEVSEFQRWLDNDERGLTPPLIEGTLTAEELHLAAELVTYYCRYRHNDWGADWIRKNLSHETLGSYSDWLDDLILLCSSHHYDKSELLGQDFDPRPVGTPAAVVHLRYLACVLRLADILEFDPERTPEVILRHREIPAESLIHWYKNVGISLAKDGSALALSARPASAKLHRAIEAMMDDIDHELQTCRSIADETHFEVCPNLDLKLPHRWDLQHAIRRDLKPKEGMYEYINGAFRPNTRKLLELFAGTHLYREPLAAVRELVQNAFDAVRERIAYQRLSEPNPLDPELVMAIRKLYRVTLRLETRSDGNWLVCRDTGIGMTMPIIKNYLLVSGRARRHDILELERRCQRAGFNLDRTGQFGIGVLSYFMIADRVAISTRRAVEAGDSEQTGWHFETEGVGSFGELRQADNLPVGSCIELHLKEEISADLFYWFGKLRTNLQKSVRYSPCQLNLSGPIPNCEPLDIKSGWTFDSTDFSDVVLKGLSIDRREEIAPELLAERDRQERQDRQQHFGALKSESIESLKWLVSSGELPKGLGRFRLHLPYFDLAGGNCLAFLKAKTSDQTTQLSRIGDGFCLYPQGQLYLSWKGILVSSKQHKIIEWFVPGYKEPNSRPVVELDFDNERAGNLSVDRAEFALSEEATSASRWLYDLAAKIAYKFSSENAASNYSTLNRRLSGTTALIIPEPKWFAATNDRTDEAVWRNIIFPAMTSLPWIYSRIPSKVLWNNKEVDVVQCLRGPHDRDHYDGPAFVDHVKPDRIVSVRQKYWSKTVAPLWEKNPFAQPPKAEKLPMISSFPEQWHNLCGVRFTHYGAPQSAATVWNESHPLVQCTDSDAYAWVQENTATNPDPLILKGELLSEQKKASAWILHFLLQDDHKLWDGVRERDPKFVSALWRLVFGKGENGAKMRVSLWFESSPDSRLREISVDGWVVEYGEGPTIERDMPDPGSEWRVEAAERARAPHLT